jgi:hypothetical protein
MAHGMLKILALEDVGLIDRALRQENILFDGSEVDTKEAFPDGINRFRPGVILFGHCFLQFNSAEALNICRSSGFQISFILVEYPHHPGNRGSAF